MIQPVRTVEETTLVITMRQRTSFFGWDINPAKIRQNAEAIRREIRSILSEHEAYSEVDILETVRMLCPECGYEWEIDPSDGLPACCDVAQNSWRTPELSLPAEER
jgi:hypothetical protein